jgi:hypothetical protein
LELFDNPEQPRSKFLSNFHSLEKTEAFDQSLKFKKLNFTITSHYSSKFKKFLVLDNINPFDLVYSLSLELNKKTARKASESKGKSGSLFFSTHNKRFLIKTTNL